MKYDLVIFDLAGTTVKDNFDVHRVLQTVLRNHNVMISLDHANDVMGIPKHVAIRDLLARFYFGSRMISSEWVNEINHEFVQRMKAFYECDDSVGEKTGVAETFRKLKSMGIKVAVNTGFDRTVTNALLGRLKWIESGLIDASATSDDVRRGRPYPDMIFAIMKETGVKDSKRVVKVGDTLADIREGHAAGCGLVVGISSGAFTEDELSVEKPHHTVAQVSQLLRYLN
jgi:phosphonatase-like hydrolase